MSVLPRKRTGGGLDHLLNPTEPPRKIPRTSSSHTEAWSGEYLLLPSRSQHALIIRSQALPLPACLRFTPALPPQPRLSPPASLKTSAQRSRRTLQRPPSRASLLHLPPHAQPVRTRPGPSTQTSAAMVYYLSLRPPRPLLLGLPRPTHHAQLRRRLQPHGSRRTQSAFSGPR